MLSYTLYCLILWVWRVLLFSPFHCWGQEVCCQRRVGIQTSSDHCLLLLAVYSTSLYSWGSPSGAAVKNLPAMQETRIWYLDQEDPLEKEIATHSSILAWEIPWTEEPGGLQSMGTQRVRNDWSNLAHTDVMALLMIRFIFKIKQMAFTHEHFQLVANIVLGQLKAHGHERLRACLDLPHSIST